MCLSDQVSVVHARSISRESDSHPLLNHLMTTGVTLENKLGDLTDLYLFINFFF